MTLITPDQFRPDWTQSQVDDRINELPLSEIEFSKLSSLYHRFYGVLTGSNEGENIAKPEDRNADKNTAKDRFVLNSCVRWQYPVIMDSIVANLESEIGYAITDRYVTENLKMHTPLARFKARNRGIETLNVKQSWGDVHVDVPVDYFMEKNVDVVEMVSGTYAARISDTLFNNPNEVVLRDDNYRVWSWFSNDTTPLSRNRIDGYWQLPLNSKIRPYAPGDTVNVQSKRYVTITIAVPEDLPQGAEIFPVYPGSHQKIPQAKPVEILESGDMKFTLYIYTLLHHDFVAESADLVIGEFWKMYQTIDFKYVMETELKARVYYTRGSTTTYIEPTLTLVDAEQGIFHLNYDCCWSDWQCLCQDWPTTVTLAIGYKTSPIRLRERYYDAIGGLRYAAACRIAADLPTFNCNCQVPYGFIPANQTAYTESYIDTQTRVVVDKLKYGKLQGHLYYAEVVNAAPRFPRITDAAFVGFLKEF